MAQWVVGVDPSTHLLGFVALSATGAQARSLHLDLGKQAYEPAKLLVAFERFAEFLATLPTKRVAVFIEEPVVGKGGVRSTMVQAYVNSALQLPALLRGFPCQLLNNQQWKAEVVGSGNATKQAVATAIMDRWAHVYTGLSEVPGLSDGTAPEDISDAAGLAIVGLQAVSRRVRLVVPSRLQGRR